MKKEVVIISLVLVVLVNLSVVSATCNEVEKITSDTSIWQGYPAVSDEKVVWIKEETNIKDDYWNSNLYVYDIQIGNSNKITTNLGTQEIFEYSSNPKISGDRIIWKTEYYQKLGADYMPLKTSLSLYDLSLGQKIQIVDYNNENRPQNYYAIHGNKVAWVGYEDSSGDNVYLYDTSNKITTKITNEANYRPANIDVYDNKVIWTAWYQPFNPSEGDMVNVYLYNSGSLGPIINNVSQATHLQIFENKVAYMKYNPTRGNIYENSNYDLHIYDINTGQSTPINLGAYSNWYVDINADFRMDSDKIIFPLIDGQGNEKGIFVYDLNDKTTIKLEDTNDDKRQVFSDTHNSKFVWVEWKSSINSIKFYNMICCIPNCTNKECGNDGCSGICGSCESGEVCSNGTCVSSGGIECNDDFDCMMEATGSPYCEGNSVCIDSISYECINEGTTQSYCNSTPIKDCTECPNGCEDNQCITSSTKECDQIGIRQSGKYCSTNYKLITQKANTISCENNFECKTNICSEGSCASKVVPPTPNNKIFWVIGIIVIVFLIVMVLIILLRSRQ